MLGESVRGSGVYKSITLYMCIFELLDGSRISEACLFVSPVPLFGYRFCVAVDRLTSLLTPVPFPSLFRRNERH